MRGMKSLLWRWGLALIIGAAWASVGTPDSSAHVTVSSQP